MFNSLNQRRVLWFLLISGSALALYYILVYRPLVNTVTALDRPLTNVWQQLISTNLETKMLESIDFAGSSVSLKNVQAARRALTQSRENILSRIALEPEFEAKLHQSCELIDFQYERQVRVEEITRLAKQHSVALGTNVISGYPRYTADEEDPATLWIELAVFHHALATAAHCKPATIRDARILPTQFHPRFNPAEAGLIEARVALDLAGPMPAISHFLLALPLKADELKQHGLPEGLATKPALFIDKWMLRKASPEKPNDVQLDITISGFAFRLPPNGAGSNLLSSRN